MVFLSVYYTTPFSFSYLAHPSRRLKRAIVIAHRPSSVRPSVVRRRPASVVVVRKLSHFQLLLQNRLMDFDETLYAWSTRGPLQVLLFFGHIRPGADPGRGKIRSRRSSSSRNFFFRPEGYSDKLNAQQWPRSMWEEVLLFLVPFRSQIFDAFFTSFWTSRVKPPYIHFRCVAGIHGGCG